MSHWPAALGEAARRDTPFVLVTVAATRGSVPREAGTRMIVFEREAVGTIGGGHLEYSAIGTARALLQDGRPGCCRLERIPLGASLGQCCGGAVQLLFERADTSLRDWLSGLAAALQANEVVVAVTEIPAFPRDSATAPRLLVSRHGCIGEMSNRDRPEERDRQEEMVSRARALLNTPSAASVCFEPPLLLDRFEPVSLHIALFGAGHVGRAIIGVLGLLPCRVTWIDTRQEEFDALLPASCPANVTIELGEQIECDVDTLAAGTFVLVMTHDHALDEAICARALRRQDLPWVGLIGSLVKRRRFEQRLLARGLSAEAIARLRCPIGIDGIDGKYPGEIAVSVAAEILLSKNKVDTAPQVPGSAQTDARVGVDDGKAKAIEDVTWPV